MSYELFAAIAQHDMSRVAALVSKGADPNATNAEGWRPLHVAIGLLGVGGTTDLIALLLKLGAKANEWDSDHNETPILSASDPPDVEAMRVLLEGGANPNVRRSTGESPLQLCVEYQSLEAVALLLQNGAGTTMNNWGGLSGLTALGLATRKFDVSMIKLLLREGVDAEALDEYDETAREKLPPREQHDSETWDQVIELLGRGKPE